jgi:hypothetical protein
MKATTKKSTAGVIHQAGERGGANEAQTCVRCRKTLRAAGETKVPLGAPVTNDGQEIVDRERNGQRNCTPQDNAPTEISEQQQ